MRDLKQFLGQDRHLAAWVACQRNSWRDVNIRAASQTSNIVQFNCKWSIRSDGLKWLWIKRRMRPSICIYSCSVEPGVSDPAPKQLVDGNLWCATSVWGGWDAVARCRRPHISNIWNSAKENCGCVPRLQYAQHVCGPRDRSNKRLATTGKWIRASGCDIPESTWHTPALQTN